MEPESGIRRRPVAYARALVLRRLAVETLGPLDAEVAVTAEPVPFRERGTLEYRPITPGRSWGRAYACAWFRITGRVPERPLPGGPAGGGPTPRLVAAVDLGGEGLAVDQEGRAIVGLSSNMTWVDRLNPLPGKQEVELALGPGDPVELWIEAGYNGGWTVPPYGRSRFGGARLVLRDAGRGALYWDYLALAYASAACGHRGRRRELDEALEQAWRATAPLRAGRDPAAAADSLAGARAILGRAMRETAFPGEPAYEAAAGLRFAAIGHSHLDLAWLWPLRETRRKAARTFATALANLGRRPDYRYGASQPQQLEWIKESRPELWERIKAEVAAGRLEPQGGMWVEADCNLPSGESLVRQLLYGSRFLEREFGRRSRICWLPDAFGFNGNLPQILKKAGIDYFMTIKLSWNEVNDFPHRSFVWTGIDGSSVLAHMPPEGDYNSGGTPLCVRRAAELYPERGAAGEALVLFGAGDGGGGPGEAHLELVSRQALLAGFPPVRQGPAEEFFDRLAERAPALPVVRGELYLEKHQGTYTTQARSKRADRAVELLLREVECLATAAWLRGRPYPAALLERAWKEALLYEFHDILPGSSVGRVYGESIARYAELTRLLEAEADAAAAALVTGEDGDSPRYANLTSYPRSCRVKGASGWLRLDAGPFASAAAAPAEGPFPVAAGPDFLESDRLLVRFAPGGHVASILDKTRGVEAVGAYANKLVLFLDPWRYFNAWDIWPGYRRLPRLVLRPSSVRTLVDGPRAIRRSLYRHGRTRIEQDVVLEAGSPLVEFETRCEWRETLRMLRAEFAPAAFGDSARFDIQFGSIERSTREDDSVSKAQFEVCGRRWVDLSEGGTGLSLINDGKYGHRAKRGVLSLGLLRSPLYPDPRADRGAQEFRYALYPHAGDALEAGTARMAALFASRPRALPRGASLASLASTDSPDVVIESIKKAEDEDAVVLRLYEDGGRPAEARLELGFEIAGLYEADLLERPLRPADPARLSFGPFELKTLLALPAYRRPM